MKGDNRFKVVVGFLMLLGFLHIFFHFGILQSGLFTLTNPGVSGNALVEGSLLDKLKASSPISSSTSVIILLIEWGTIFFLVVFFSVKRKIEDKAEFESLNVNQQKMEKSWAKTDLDNFYEVLKERKTLKLATISKAYSVNKDTVMSWGRALETANLIRIEYPFFGDPKFVYVEKRVNEEKKA